ncbi:MAG TPA: hypothetical protein PKV80_15155 [Leptospiraceae bacterium]|nr:hypothetical protein [Leptospiraceae bacterium]HNF25806.1 hypothetical protein [Leptospiraceae bacterium]HNI98055.1 hypothetical protein [Leptospiraceae bacterium]
MVLILLLFSTAVFAESRFTVDSFGFGTRVREDRSAPDLRSENGFYLIPGISGKTDSGRAYSGEFGARILFRSGKADLFFSENSYVNAGFGKFGICAGRRPYSEKFIRSAWTDGTEGIWIYYRFNDRIMMNLSAFDWYRGFPLLENDLLKKTADPDFSSGRRQRNGLRIYYNDEKMTAGISLQYLNLGNFGHSSKDEIRKNGGDSDYLWNASAEAGGKWKFITGYFRLLLSRGMDKTEWNETRRDKSMPNSGEALEAGAGADLGEFRLNLHFFLPDTDRRDSAGNIIESGYVGTGNGPERSVLLFQTLGFMPSAWVTEEGMEKRFSIVKGRRNSFYSGISAEYARNGYFFRAEADCTVPYANSSSSNGKIGISRNSFEPWFIAEGALSAEFRENDFFMKIRYSHLWTQKNISVTGDMISFSGGFLF